MSAERVKVTVGVCGGIAAYKAVELVRLLQEAGLDPHVVMTVGAEKFVGPLTFEAITGHRVMTSLWAEGTAAAGSVVEMEAGISSIEHINEAQTTRMLIVAPATASTLAKFAHGLADDFLSTMFLAMQRPVIVAPSMNVVMWGHPATQANVAMLQARGVRVVEPGSGYLACGMVGGGRLAEPKEIVRAVMEVLGSSSEEAHFPEPRHATAAAATGNAVGAGAGFAGETVLVTAGGTREAIDPVRFIGNRSSGRMGYAVAAAARARGAKVILVTAATGLPCPAGVEAVQVVSAAQMRDAVMQRLGEATVVVMAAAVSDYKVKNVAGQKIKRERMSTMTLELEATEDILRQIVSHRKTGTLVVGFAAETEEVLANGRLKLERKGVDAVVVNDVSEAELGFDSERNAGSFLTASGTVEFPAMTKVEMAGRILDEVKKLRG